MTKKRIAINGFGRIGRLTFRNLIANPNVEVVAINDLTDNKTLAHLLKYDSAQGKFDGTVTHDQDSLTVNGIKIAALSEKDPSQLPWKELQVDTVIESTGVFRTKEKASFHINAGAKKVVLSAPGDGEGIETVVMGVNKEELTDEMCILSNASCTTNCLAPLVKIIHENWGIDSAFMTTTHAYTADQNIQDAPHKDLRRARAAAFNIVPTSTGAAVAVEQVYPAVQGKLSAMALRVPVLTGSLVDLTCIVNNTTSADEVNAVFKAEAEGKLKGVLEYCEDPIVSADIVGNTHSSVFDSLLTETKGKMLKVVSWYDNEAGYSARLADLVSQI